MLILHPSSCCDVCLEAYTWQTIAQTPHAIPCGHVFCRPCLFALNPYICPLCRKKFEPNKAKKLHVDRPENVDENRESDLLQKLAISWAAPDVQLQQTMLEVDTWLDTRADDTCIVLRKARAALERHLELKKTERTLQTDLADMHTRYSDMVIAYDKEHQEAVAAKTRLKADNSTLTRENEELKAKVEELRAASHHSSWKNPLPPPPRPVSNEYLPTFAQAMARERMRFDLPAPTIGSPTAQSFEVEVRKRRKGKARSADHRLISPDGQNPYPLPTQLAKMDPSEEGHALISHFGDHSPPQRRTSTPAPPSGLQLQFEHMHQPLDPFELTQTYLREYSQGLLDGQLLAEKATSGSTSERSHASTRRSRSDVSLPDSNEFIDSGSIQSIQSPLGHEIQPASGPSVVPRPPNRRQNTVSSIATSAESSAGQRSRNRSGSSSRSSSNQIGNPSLVALLSNDTQAPSASSRGPAAPALNPSPNPSIPSLSQPSHEQRPEALMQPNLTRTQSPATSHVSKASSWGTIISTSTNKTTYSLLGLRDFREGSYPRIVNSDAVSVWSSPTRRVSSMVGVIPPHETVGGSAAASPRTRGHNGGRTHSQRLSQHPPPSPSLVSWHGSVASLSPTQEQFSNGHHYSDNGNDDVVRPNELLNPGYSWDSTGNHPRIMESQRMTRGRNQPLPTVSPSFLLGESIFVEENDRSNHYFTETFGNGNALGLELTTGPTPISAPTPVVPHRSFLRSFSDET